MSSFSLFNKSELVKFFSLQPEAFRNIYDQITNIYQNNPIDFANTFLDQLAQINPKTVRIICYQLYIAGITLDKIYLQYTNGTPKFLSKLDKFPLETMMVLLKYKFPAYPNGNLFFLSSLDSANIEGEGTSPYPTDLYWLDFVLNVCIHQEINLNHINRSTGSTCLHSAIRMGFLPIVQLVLSHRVNPNTKSIQGISPLFSAIESLELPGAEITYQAYIEIIRQLRMYGATIDDAIKEQIKNSSYKNQVNKALSSGKILTLKFSSLNTFYFSLDPIEDLVLIAELDPLVMNDVNFPITPSSFKEAIMQKRDKTIFVNNVMWDWPYYMNDTMLINNQQCYLNPDKRVSASSPPNSQQVYRQVLENIPEINPYVIVDLPTQTPAGTDNTAVPTEYGTLIPTFPLSSGPMLPTGQPILPSL